MSDNCHEHSRNLEQFREYLSLIARVQLDARLQAKVDLSGVVQQTLLEAHQANEHTPPGGEEHLVRRLRKILANNLLDEVRKFRAQARDVDRERSLDAALEASSARTEGWLAAEQSSPSQRAMRNEQIFGLADALAKLPDDQRQAVELHHLNGLALNDIAQQMDRTKGAVASLLFRALKKLNELLREDYLD